MLLQRVWVVLEEKGLDYQYKEINPYKKEKEFLAINPKGLVPALIHHSRNLNESQVIMEYLEDITSADKRLYPEDPYERAVARLWMDHVAKKICPVFFKILLAQARICCFKSSPLQQHFLVLTLSADPSSSLTEQTRVRRSRDPGLDSFSAVYCAALILLSCASHMHVMAISALASILTHVFNE